MNVLFYTACVSDPWACEDGSCVSDNKLCDGIYDCPKRSDEANCGNLLDS